MAAHILLDLDGVLVNFVAGALRVHNRLDLLDNWPPGEDSILRVLGLASDDEFWRPIDAQGHDYWANLEPYPWLTDLLELVGRYGTFTIATKPALSHHAAAGKVLWMNMHLPHTHERGAFHNFFIGHEKHLLAGPGRILIDDNEGHVGRFREHGGQAILFPQAWNELHAIETVAGRLAHVARQLEQLA